MLWKKYDIVNEVNRRNDTPVSILAKKLEISRTSLITILKNIEKTIEDFEAGCSRKTKRKRKYNFGTVDEPLMKWFRQARDEKIPVSGEMLLLKAQRVRKSLRLCNSLEIKHELDKWMEGEKGHCVQKITQ